jgi:heme-degrading monooxygenase HmoA
MKSTTTCTADTSHGGMTIAAFIIAIFGLCVGIAALVMSIVNTVRIRRIRRRLDDCKDTPEAIHDRTTHIKSNSNAVSAIFHPSIKPPYYACIFTSRLNLSEPKAIDGYSILADEMDQLAKRQEGYLGIDSSTRNTDGMGITISYWRTEDDIKRWKLQVDHRAAQLLGEEKFYLDYHVQVAKVEREYAMKKTP